MRKKLFTAITLLLFVFGCSNDPVNDIKKPNKGEAVTISNKGYLVFSSKKSVKDYLDGIKQGKHLNVNADSRGMSKFKSLADISREVELKNATRSRSDDEMEEMTEDEFRVFLAEEIVKDPAVYEIVDTSLRIGIGDDLYKISKYGTFIAPQEQEQVINYIIRKFTELRDSIKPTGNEDEYEIKVSTDGGATTNRALVINPTYDHLLPDDGKGTGGYHLPNDPGHVGNDNTGNPSAPASDDEDDATNAEFGIETGADVSFLEYADSDYELKTYKWKEKTLAGKILHFLTGSRDIQRNNKFNKNLRTSCELFRVNYGFYASTGFKVKLQKRKHFLGIAYWKQTKAEKMVVGIDQLDIELKFNTPPSKTSTLLGHERFGYLTGTLNNMAVDFIIKKSGSVGFLNDLTENIINFVVGDFTDNIPNSLYNKIYQTPGKQVYKFFKSINGKYIANPVTKMITPKDPRTAYFCWGGSNTVKTYTQGITEYLNKKNHTIYFSRSFGFYWIYGMNLPIGFLPVETKIKRASIFGAVQNKGQWKGIKFIHNL